MPQLEKFKRIFGWGLKKVSKFLNGYPAGKMIVFRANFFPKKGHFKIDK